MLVTLCSNCGRVGILEPPETAEDISCLYCGMSDIDWISRPDLEEPTESFFKIEKKVLEILHQVYEINDYAAADAENREAKLHVLLEHLSDLPHTD